MSEVLKLISNDRSRMVLSYQKQNNVKKPLLQFQSSLKNFQKIIDYSAFEECTSLCKVTFQMPSSIWKIENYAFNKCSFLAETEIPSSVKVIEYISLFKDTSLKYSST